MAASFTECVPSSFSVFDPSAIRMRVPLSQREVGVQVGNPNGKVPESGTLMQSYLVKADEDEFIVDASAAGAGPLQIVSES